MSGSTDGEPDAAGQPIVDQICPQCLAVGERRPVCRECHFDDRAIDQGPDALRPGTVLHERYFVGLVLGEGGFGITYRGLEMATSEKVAIKEFLPGDIARRSTRSGHVTPNTADVKYFVQGLQRFREEASALRQFDHPCIVRVLDYFEANGTGYLVMPYLEGKTLTQYLDAKGGRLPFDLAVNVLVPVMAALQEAHAAQLLHRDVSPENIYITAAGGVILLDFGAARSAVAKSKKTVVVKRGFTPKEVIDGGEQGPFTDVYGLAATLYCACVGRPPRCTADDEFTPELVPPSGMDVAIAPSAERVLLRALAWESGERYQSIADFQRELRDTAASPRGATLDSPTPIFQETAAPPRDYTLAVFLVVFVGVTALIVSMCG